MTARFHPNAPARGISQTLWARLTPFQQQVYRAVCRIPTGQTRSYQWVARRIGRPRAVRAVGNALSNNPFAPFVPCHRVVCSDGSLGGFMHGVDAKRRLLDAERRRSRRTTSSKSIHHLLVERVLWSGRDPSGRGMPRSLGRGARGTRSWAPPPGVDPPTRRPPRVTRSQRGSWDQFARRGLGSLLSRGLGPA